MKVQQQGKHAAEADNPCTNNCKYQNCMNTER